MIVSTDFWVLILPDRPVPLMLLTAGIHSPAFWTADCFAKTMGRTKRQGTL
jgi:hypothetical protein